MSKASEQALSVAREAGGQNRSLSYNTLPPVVKKRIVVLFAQFQPVSAIIRTIEEEFGIALPAHRVARYDPARPYSECGKALRTLYAQARQRYLEDVSEIGIAHQTHRLRTLERLAAKAEEKGQFGTVASLLKQAAEEMGGVLTNERRVNVVQVHLSPEDARAELALRLGAFVEQVEALPPPEAKAPDQG